MAFNPGNPPPLALALAVSWSPTCIPISAGKDQEPLNICDTFKWVTKTRVLHSSDSKIILPPALYKPEWEFRADVEAMII